MLRTGVPDQLLAAALPVLEALIFDEHEKYPDIVPELFNIVDSSRWGEQDLNVAPLQPAVERNEGAAYTFDDPIEGFSKTYIPLEYALACNFSETFIEDDRLGMVEDTYRSLGASMFQTKQIVSMGVYNDGFSDTGPDSGSLFNSSHSHIDGNSYGNRPSTDIGLSIAGIREMEVDIMRQVNHRNINIYLMPEIILVPPDLSQLAEELIYSTHRPDSPNNAINTFFKKQYKLRVSPYLTSLTAWFAQAAKGRHKLKFIDRLGVQVKSWEDEGNGMINTRARMRFDVSYSDYIGTWGTTG